MKRPSLLALCVAAAGLALVPSVHAEDLRQVFFVLYDDASTSAQDPAVPMEQAGPTDADRQLADLREQIARDLSHE
ncbi:MAG TPA: hypothetical protein VHQ02_01850 [Usitatibacter sp.]|jgi:hypothetical protein|nr:hypothetical protein [Usitatibacter sp.]